MTTHYNKNVADGRHRYRPACEQIGHARCRYVYRGNGHVFSLEIVDMKVPRQYAPITVRPTETGCFEL